MAKRRISKGSKRRIVIFGSVSIIIIFYFVIVGVQYIVNINSLEQEEQRLTNELLALKEEEDELKTEIKKLKDPDYVARYAREKYLYSKDGEYVIRIDLEEEIELPNKKALNYNRMLTIGSSSALMLYMLIRRKK